MTTAPLSLQQHTQNGTTMTTIATALKATEDARADLSKTLGEVADDFRTHLALALDALKDRAVIEQHEITIAMDAAERVILKQNIAQARESALQSVDAQLAKLDLDELAKKANPSLSGGSYVEYREVLSPLLSVTGDLLTKAGYNVAPFTSSRFGRGYDITNIRGVGSLAGTAARRLDAAIENCGNAMHKLAEAKTVHAQSVARELWDKAE